MAEVVLRQSVQEIEIEHFLAEEFACDPGFAGRFLTAFGLLGDGLHITATVAELSLGGDGFGDLLVQGSSNASPAGVRDGVGQGESGEVDGDVRPEVVRSPPPCGVLTGCVRRSPI